MYIDYAAELAQDETLCRATLQRTLAQARDVRRARTLTLEHYAAVYEAAIVVWWVLLLQKKSVHWVERLRDAALERSM